MATKTTARVICPLGHINSFRLISKSIVTRDPDPNHQRYSLRYECGVCQKRWTTIKDGHGRLSSLK